MDIKVRYKPDGSGDPPYQYRDRKAKEKLVGGVVRIVLSDGTKVWIYPKKRVGKKVAKAPRKKK